MWTFYDGYIDALKAIAEPTRFRLTRLCAQGELTVSELMRIVGQSQPRVSRHLKLLQDAGVRKVSANNIGCSIESHKTHIANN